MTNKIAFALGLLFVLSLFSLTTQVSAAPPRQSPTTPTPSSGRLATVAEIAKAKLDWTQSGHANTFDNGAGANTTCARCKSPMNWDARAPAAQNALDCGACKRVPGAPRPDLEGGVPVATTAWKNIGCEVCHQPVGNSYSTALSFWNNDTQKYQPVRNANELCAHCHEGQHGFEVMTEQEHSPAHKGWSCTQCHGSHNKAVACTDCHDPKKGRGAAEHAKHPLVNCTACHDAGGLSVALETEAPSRIAARHLNTYITLRFAHTLTSWPSHNLQLEVDCKRCHHPQGTLRNIVAVQIGCDVCHEEGASLFWCTNFPRNPDPYPTPTPAPKR
jgi:hypothetical protein